MIKAMKQALEALEILARYENPETRIQVRKPKDGGPIVTMYPHKVASDAAQFLRQAIEQAEKQEPVVWMYQDKSTHEVRFQKHMRSFVDHGATYETPLYTTPQPQRELNCVCGAVWEGDEMVCVPHKREWVGLTDEEIALVCAECAASAHNWDDISFARAIEAKLKEKNT